MQIAKKYFSEGLIQLTILLSLVGVRVDIDSYLTGYYSPLAEINVGPSSAYIQTPFHILRDTLDGNGVHPKCPELDSFFASRRLLDEVRSLGSPRFPTQLNAWLVHQVSATDRAEHGPSTSDDTDSSPGLEDLRDEAGCDSEHLPARGQEVEQTSPELGQGPGGAEACVFPQQVDEAKVKEEEEAFPITQLAHSSMLEQESLFDGNPILSDLEHRYASPPSSTVVDWSNLLSVTDFDELDSLVNLSELDADITSAISQDVSLHDATVSSAGAFGAGSGRSESRTVAQQRRTLLRLELLNSTLSDASPGMAVGLAALPFASVCNLTGNASSQSLLGGCLDEAVFDQINQLGLEGLDSIDNQLMNSLGCVDSQGLEDLDSDSGLSLESSYGGPASPGSSEMSSSSSLYCEDEGGATGYSSDVDSLPSKGMMDHTTVWPPVDLSENVWHDHSYSSPAFLNKPSLKLPQKTEAFSDDDDDGSQLEERELSRDELRARAMYIPFSVLQIVNMPVEEFMEILDGHGFTPAQVTLLRDIRRRGKNKLAAQNCRKRKLDAITGLQEEVERLQAQRDRLLREKQLTAKTMGAVGHQIRQLTRDVLARLRDGSGLPLSPERFTLQCGANGRVVIQPIRRPVSASAGNKTDKRKKGKKQ
ncbi:nuclear factor erythroid 2-related factor 3 isoform X2 [Austrofundulus limnaeus]|uniref:Nuclear factor erythroid 2-related factor 3 isoform X2 n=1 Tax=Austrofundulus limnaeus TaxID=52670 RepID=A0A2I4BG06_AUSLI|nr:PREDICTED: nuclear factor erythroid 2-related factor 1-like isoform X2 [Austrofundulus limnaeus]